MRYSIFFLSLLMLQSCAYQDKTVDIIVHNALIYTVDGQFSVVEAMAIDSGRIVQTGSEREILNKYQAEETINAEGRSIYPGFIDSHCHFLGYGLSRQEVNLRGTDSWEDCIDRMKLASSKNNNPWLEGRGWDQNDWPITEFPTHELLSKTFPNRPVILYRVDGHAAIANSKAMELAGVAVAVRVSGGVMVVDDEGLLTGLMIDNAMNKLTKYIPNPDASQLRTALIAAQEDCFEVGLTTVDDAGLDTSVVGLISRMHSEGSLKMRIYAMLEATDEGKELMKKGIISEDRLTVRSIKLYGDGALGSRGAALKKDYHDHKGHRGSLIRPPVFYKQWAALCKLYGFQMNVHCIGDRANEIILAVFRDQLKGNNDLRWRVEHAQMISGKDMDEFGKYNILPSVQPTHATSDMDWVAEIIGEERLKGAYANASLLRQNGIALLGTDFPVEEIDPLLTFYAAVFRKNKGGEPVDGWHMSEALTREEALRGMTIWGAMGNFEEDRKGSLESGKVADFVILDRDIMTVSDSNVLRANVVGTFIGGEKVY